MAYFDRFDVCGAYYVAAAHHLIPGWTDVLERLRLVRYRPGLSERRGRLPKTAEFENERAVLAQLLRRHRRELVSRRDDGSAT